MGDHKEELWKRKLSFVPVVSLGHFGAENLAKLRQVHKCLVEVVRMRGGGVVTKKYQSGTSCGRTVVSGGRVPKALIDGNPDVKRPSGTIQLKDFSKFQ